MGTKFVSTLDIEMNLDVNTDESCSRALQTIIQVLLFQRSQIPFCYEVFKTIVKKLQLEMIAADSSKLKSYQMAKQREVAIHLLTDIQTLLKEVTEIAHRIDHDIQAMVLFGSTPYTAKEAFIIKIPVADRNHYSQHHRQGLDSAMKQLTRKIILSEELRPSGLFVGPTNIFLMIGISSTGAPMEQLLQNAKYRLVEYRLPRNCQTYVINLVVRGADGNKIACCKHMDIFSDSLQNLKIDDSEVASNEADQENSSQLINSGTKWYQIGKGLKGFNDVLIKGKSIWNEGL